jgi:hypothetical protein
MRGFGGGQSNVMMMRNESISDSLVAMLGSCASPHVGLQGVHWTIYLAGWFASCCRDSDRELHGVGGLGWVGLGLA